MRQGDSDRDIARSKTMGRKKIAQVREIANERGWLAPEASLPEDAVLASVLARKEALPASCISTLEPWREQITKWHAAGIQGSTIHATLKRNHGYTGSYSSVHRFLCQLIDAQEPDVPLRLTFKPAEAAQVDFGAGPSITDVLTGEIFKTWFFVITLCWSRHQYAEFVRKLVAAELKAIYRATTETEALQALESFAAGPWGLKYPPIVAMWRRQWQEVIPFFAYPLAVRRIMYTTNAIESLNMQIRKVIKNRGHFPNDDAATKLIWLALRNITKDWKMPPVTWRAAKTQFAILFAERFTAYL
jgi:hypothetical protein